MPLKRSQCPSMSEAVELPACHAFLGANAVCEADAEASECKFQRSLGRFRILGLGVYGLGKRDSNGREEMIATVVRDGFRVALDAF